MNIEGPFATFKIEELIKTNLLIPLIFIRKSMSYFALHSV